MSALRQYFPEWTPESYLKFERMSPAKHEFVHGYIVAMAGARRKHLLISTNTVRLLGNQLIDRPCEVYSADMRVNVGKNYVYPDVVVVCGEPTFIDGEFDTLTNPTVIIEVLSQSTAQYDRVTKRQLYAQIASVQDYLLFDSETMHAEHYSRRPDGTWAFVETTDSAAMLQIASIGCALTLGDVYAKVEMPIETD